MDRAAFDGLRVIRREWECDTGCSDVCRTSAGEACIRLQIRDGACQREVLSGGAKSAVRLDGGTLEILLPYRDGAPFDKWLERKPSLGQRRDACLAIVAQCIEEKASPTVIELSAKAENLRFTEHGVGLQLLPDWGAWRRTAAADTATVQAVAALCAELLTGGFSKVQEHLDFCPFEQRLLSGVEPAPTGPCRHPGRPAPNRPYPANGIAAGSKNRPAISQACRLCGGRRAADRGAIVTGQCLFELERSRQQHLGWHHHHWRSRFAGRVRGERLV